MNASEVERWRGEFPILERRTYLNSCSLGALSDRAVGRVGAFHEEWHTYGAAAWYQRWLGRLEELRVQVGRLLGADAEEIALAPSISAALAIVASAVDHRTRPEVVVAELDFPTLAYQWMARPDAELVRVRSEDGATIDLQRFADAVTERTALIATSHVFFTTGAIQDLKALAEIAHDKGALLLVDAYQGAGQIPIDVRESDVDILVTGPLKWLLGGPGVAYLYIREELVRQLRPKVAGWFGTQKPFEFDITSLEFREDARRFELGTPALPTVHTALGGQSIIEEIGVARIRERNRSLTERLIERAREAGFPLRTAPGPEQRSAIVMIGADDPAAAVVELERRGIIIDWRPGYVRISPHFYNTEDEIDAAVDALVEWRDG